MLRQAEHVAQQAEQAKATEQARVGAQAAAEVGDLVAGGAEIQNGGDQAG